jgi:transcriptional regulator with XRE-family HTH domain
MAETLRSLRKRKYKTLERLADASGLSEGFLSHLEAGKKRPGNKARAALCAAYAITEVRLQELVSATYKDAQGGPRLKTPETPVTPESGSDQRTGQEAYMNEAKSAIISKILTQITAQQLPLLEAFVDALASGAGEPTPGPQMRGRMS